FPEILTEGKIDFKILQDVLGNEIEEEDEYYRFTWAGKAQARREAHKPSTGTLRPAKEESVNWDTTQNLYIEGDNLEVLKLLQKSYAGKVKMIYIDPPYNTGKDFVYKDNYKDNLKNYQEITGQIDSDGNKLTSNSESEGRYHSNWLNMIYPRLRLARNLLKDDGIIFISIGEEEISNLRSVSDEIFGSDNFISNIIWQSRTSISNDQAISMNHNHTLIYCKKIELLNFGGEPLKQSEYSNPDRDERGPWKLVPIDANKAGGDTSYGIVNPKTGEEYFPPNGRIWAFNSLEYKRLFDDNRIKFGKTDDSSPKKKLFLIERLAKGDVKTPSSILLTAGTTKNGTTEIMDLFDNKKVFSYPKPSSLIKRLLRYGKINKSDIVLDFFSGSASTAQAIMELNIEDSGKRQYIQVQLPEDLEKSLLSADSSSKKAIEVAISFLNRYSRPKYLTEIGKERIRRAGKKIIREQNEKIEQLKEKAKGKMLQEEALQEIEQLQTNLNNLDIGFKVFKLDSSNIKGWDGNPNELEQSLFDAVSNIKDDRSEEDVLYEILLKYGLDLTLPIEKKTIEGKTVFNVGYGALFICLADNITSKVAEGIGKWKEELQPEICRVIFKDTGFTDVEKTNSVQTLKRFGITEIKSI
ncbi:MAG: site-specific DNA-methyltransferase, partial [Bacteroidetes bacterium 4572_77]